MRAALLTACLEADFLAAGFLEADLGAAFFAVLRLAVAIVVVVLWFVLVGRKD